MGTRADFYVGRGSDAEWLGSIAFDGYPYGVFDEDFRPADCPADEVWREKVATFLDGRDDATLPGDGWPWPWDDSRTTDYAYAWEDGEVYGSCFGHKWFTVDPAADNFGEDEDEVSDKSAVFPDMTDRKNVIFGKRSGAMFISSGGDA
jgi:hypothetical protein